MTECNPVVVSASSEEKLEALRAESLLKKRVDLILNRISRAKSRRTADVV
jgi:hypothetical protein